MANIIIADDSEDVAYMVAEMLTREGHVVDVVDDGRKLIARIEAGANYDVIITDLLMPNMDGFGVLRYLKNNNIDVPVFVLSGGGVTLNSDDALKSVEALATGVMKKPVKCGELLEKINSVL
ncbi:MAG: response regulator transcription factor [Alphaproteobacteria bacterium]